MRSAIIYFRTGNKALAQRLATHPSLGDTELWYWPEVDQNALSQLGQEVSLLLFIGSLGIVTRLISGILSDKQTDPGVLCVDQAGQWCIPVTGGHARHLNRLARELSAAEGMHPVITTAGDGRGTIGPEELSRRLGCRLRGERTPLKQIAGTLLDGNQVPLWYRDPLIPPTYPGYRRQVLEQAVPEDPQPFLLVTDRFESFDHGVTLHPPTLVLGIGFRSETTLPTIEQAIVHFLNSHQYSRDSVVELATLDRKTEPLAPLATRWGIKLTGFSSEALRATPGTFHSPCARKHLDLPGVAEPVLALRGAECLVGKTVYPGITLALGRIPWKKQGRLTLISLGPGPLDLITPRALNALEDSDFIVGYRTYLETLPDRFRSRIVSEGTAMGQERLRLEKALSLAREGNEIAVVSSGDIGVFGMTAPGVEMALRSGIPFRIVPGVTASLWAASLLGSPLVNGFTAISLSDYLVPWTDIVRDLTQSLQTGLPLAVYNLVERDRSVKIDTLCALVTRYRGPDTVVGIVRKDGFREIVSIAALNQAHLTMQTILIIGSDKTTEHSGYLITERGYSS